MDGAQPDMDLRVNAVYRHREALQTVHAGNQDILRPRFLSSVSTLSQNFAPSFSASHMPGNSFWPPVDTRREDDGFVYYAAILADFYDNAVHINNGIQRIQLPVLPLRNLLFDGVGDFRYQRGRHIRVVHLFEGGDDCAGGHAFGVEGENLAVHLRNTRLVLLKSAAVQRYSHGHAVCSALSCRHRKAAFLTNSHCGYQSFSGGVFLVPGMVGQLSIYPGVFHILCSILYLVVRLPVSFINQTISGNHCHCSWGLRSVILVEDGKQQSD